MKDFNFEFMAFPRLQSYSFVCESTKKIQALIKRIIIDGVSKVILFINKVLVQKWLGQQSSFVELSDIMPRTYVDSSTHNIIMKSL